MPLHLAGRRRLVASISTLALIATPLSVGLASPAAASPDGDALVISEAFGGGGNSGATWTHDFVELYNPTEAAIVVDGMSVQYRSSGNNLGAIATLAGSVPAGAHYLVQGSAGAGGTSALPTPDATGDLSMSGSNGIVVLADATSEVDPATAGDELVDLVGYGSATQFEGTGATPALSSTTSAQRDAVGTDTDDNAADFTTPAPTPTNSAGEDAPPPPPPAGDPVAIAEIQGTGDTSPLSGQSAATDGVVTAAYALGTSDAGLFIQTAGTGGDTDATPGASDGLFVRAANFDATAYAIGDSVEVTGMVAEQFGVTQITPAADGIAAVDDLGDVTALDTALPAAEADREAHESELIAPDGAFTVTDTYNANTFGELGLASGDTPLIQPTEVEDAQTGDVAGVAADNAARGIVLDDGSTVNYTSGASGTPVPYLTQADGSPRDIRVGQSLSFVAPVVMHYGFSRWRFQPTMPLANTDALPVELGASTRTEAPEAVPGELTLATFNVLNYFTTTGEEYVAGGGSCTYYNDREGNPVTTRDCGDEGPRGAADNVNLARQQAKIVDAINTLGADVVSLEEIENSAKYGADRDEALATLVEALNTAIGSDTWAFVPSPAAGDLPAVADEDVIRTAFIYDQTSVETVGTSRALVGSAAFSNAREPLAQTFKALGADDAEAFNVIVNHFKSKGSGVDDGTGQGNANPDRVAQAEALADFADDVQVETGVAATFLTGDFNAYSMEDPMQVLYGVGYTAVESDIPGEETYSFSGLSGSLDHVLANDAALATVEGADIWNINSPESVAFEYSRYNNNITEFYSDDVFRASDHDPRLVGFTPAEGGVEEGTAELNLLSVNDFHGRIFDNTVKWAGTVEQLRAEEGDDHTLFVGAGDLIGASLFASNVQQDQPTIDVLNALGLDASAVGNHEFDKGWIDLRDRVIGPDGDRNALWDYLGANVYEKGTTDPVLPEFALFTVDGVDVAVVGAVTEETASLVSPAGIADIEFGNAVDAVNRVAGELQDGDEANGEADVIVATFHAGANQGTATYEENLADGGEFAEMADLDPGVDVIFNGHTHQVYVYDAPVTGGDLPTRPLLQTGSYANNVGQVTLEVDRETGEVTSYEARNVARTDTPDDELAAAYPRVAEVQQIVNEALAFAAEVGNQPIADITGDITTAFAGGSYGENGYEGGSRDDRASESTLGDLVGNALRDGIDVEEEPDLGLTNPGGLRAELLFAGDTDANPANTDGVVTYAEANAVLPFANTVALVDLTGAELKQVFEQQWQTNPGGPTPSRPYLQLGMSDNVRVTADPTRDQDDRVTSIWIDGAPIDPAATYTVSTLSFLAAGGDNFRAFTDGDVTDTGFLDVELWRDYLAAASPISPDFARQQVNEDGLPDAVDAGDEVSFTVSNLDMTSLGSPQNTTFAVYLGTDPSTKVGEFEVVDGTAEVSFTVPDDVTGPVSVSGVALPTGTLVGAPITGVETMLEASAEPTQYGTDGTVEVTLTSDVPVSGGTVQVLNGDEVLGEAAVSRGAASVTVPGTALDPGRWALTVSYSGDDIHDPATGLVTYRVDKAMPAVEVTPQRGKTQVRRGSIDVDVAVSAEGYQPTGFLGLYVDGTLVDVAELDDGGAATMSTGRFRTVGRHVVEVLYAGDDYAEQAAGQANVRANKQKPAMVLKLRDKAPQGARPLARARLSAVGTPVRGTVVFRYSAPRSDFDFRQVSVKVRDGVAKFRLPTQDTRGRGKLVAQYQGSDLLQKNKRVQRIRITR